MPRQTRSGATFSPFDEAVNGVKHLTLWRTGWSSRDVFTRAASIQVKHLETIAEEELEGTTVQSRVSSPSEEGDEFDAISGSWVSRVEAGVGEVNPASHNSPTLQVNATVAGLREAITVTVSSSLTAALPPVLPNQPLNRRQRKKAKLRANTAAHASCMPPLPPLPSSAATSHPLASGSPSTHPLPRPSSGTDRRRHDKRSSVKKRRLAESVNIALTHRMKASTVRRYHTVDRISRASLEVTTLPHSGGGSWMGQRDTERRKTPYTLEELEKQGYQYVTYEPGSNVLLCDDNDVVIGGLVDRPPAEDWAGVLEEVARCLRTARMLGEEHGAFPSSFHQHRRGSFLAIPVGVSMGGGQTCPGNLVHTVYARQRIAQAILRNHAMRRLAGFQSSAFAFLAPKMFKRYSADLGALFKHHDNLVWNFSNSIFPASSFNCGPESVSIPHFDFNNWACGLCTLTPVGNFDWRCGGHLVLHTLKIVMEFPPGTTAVVPSAAVKHSNVCIRPGEERMSVAQYAAGGLFRWVAYGFRTGKSLDSTHSGRAQRVRLDKAEGVRWNDGCSLFSTSASLESDYSTL